MQLQEADSKQKREMLMADFGDRVVWKMVAVLDGGKMVAMRDGQS